MLGATAVMTGLPVFAQVENRRSDDPIDARTEVEKTSQPLRSDIYINESFEAADALAKARGHVERGRWREAAEVLQQASDAQGEKLVRSSGGYVSARRRIADVICAWPMDGVKQYQALYGPVAASEWSSQGESRSVDDLLPLFERYFCTPVAIRLGDAIGQLAIESGDLSLADYIYRRIIDHHPDRSAWEGRCRAMLAMTAAMRGEDVNSILSDHGDVRLRWKGQDRTLREIVADIGSGYVPLQGREEPGDWPMFAGNADRNRNSTTSVDEPGLLWKSKLAEQDASDKRSGIVDALVQSGRDEGRGLTMFPVVSGDLVFAQLRRDIIALHRRSGMSAWRLRSGAPPADPMAYLEDQPPGWDSPVVDQGRLFATLPTGDGSFYNYDSEREVHELVCLDAASGREIWRSPQNAPDAQGTIAAYDSAPIVRNGRVYVVSRKRRSFGFEDAFLDCHRAKDGRLLFRTHLGSASTSSFGLRGATKSVCAFHGDSVFVCTNLGTVAAVSAFSGAVRWLRLYERYRPDGANASAWAPRDIQPWNFNPVVYSEGRLVILPTDSARLLLLSAEDGSILQAASVESIGGMQTVFGLKGNLLCGAGESIVCYDVAMNEVRWTKRMPEGTSIHGRGAWAGDDILVPHRNGYSRFRVEDGSRTDVAFAADRRGGNLLVLPEHVIVAEVDELSCYARKSDIWNNLRDRMAAAPGDPLPALEFAEVAFGAGETDQALKILDEAVRRVSPSLSAGDPVIRERILGDVLNFVGTVSKAKPNDKEVLDKLYGIAGESAQSPASNIAYRFRFADVFSTSDQPARAVRLYQQVLYDRSLRDLPAFPGDSANRPAAAFARARIGELVGQFGADVYAEFEAEAARRLESARNAKDGSGLLAVAEVFPNSRSAPQALVFYGDILAASGRHDEAARQFARAYHRFNAVADRPVLLQKIAAAYKNAGQSEHAFLWLTKAAREFPKARMEDGGRRFTFSELRDRLGDVRSHVNPSRPRIALPLQRRYQMTIGESARLLVPVFNEDAASRWTAFFVHSPDGIQAYDAGTGKPLWDAPANVNAPPELLVVRSDVIVFATPFEVFGLAPESGARRWIHGEHPVRLADPGGDWEDAPTFRTHALHGDRLVSARDDGSLTCVHVATGDVLWRASRRPAPLGRLRLTDSLVAYHFVRDGAAVIGLLDAATGERFADIATDERRSIEDLFVTLDRQVVVATSQSLAAYDVETQARRWQSNLTWFLRSASVVFNLDSVCFIDEGGDLRKLSLEDGHPFWTAERVANRGDDDVTVRSEGDYLFVTSAATVCAVDSTTGLVLWHGTTPPQTRFVSRMLTDGYVVAANVVTEPGETAFTAYFYDYRNASGVIAKNGGALDLGEINDLKAIQALDGAILIQDGTTIRGFTSD